MADLGKAYVQIVPSAQGIGDSVSKTLKPKSEQAGKESGKTIAETISSEMTRVGKSMMKVGGIMTAFSVPIVAGIKDALGAYDTQLQAETKLIEIYRTRMGVSEDVARATMQYASELQKTGIIGDEVALSGAQQLATFAEYPDTINTLLPAMNNLLAQQKGFNATSEDAIGIGNLMGKVLQGQTGALKRVGISFTAAQEEVLKYGTEEERAAMLAEVINANVGNMNETMADTPLGKITQMNNALGDLKESVGAALAPTIADIAEKISTDVVPAIERFIAFIDSHPIIGKIIVGLGALLAIGGPLIIFIGSIVTAVGAIIPVITSLTAAVGALNIASLPITGTMLLIAAAIAAVIAIGILLYKHWDEVKAFAIATWESIKNVFIQTGENIKATVQNLITSVKTFFSNMKDAVVGKVLELWTGITERFTAIKTAVTERVQATVQGVRDKFENMKNTIKSKCTEIVSGVKERFQAAKDAISEKLEAARDKVKSIIDKIKGFFKFKISWPHIPVPHFSISPSGWKIGDLLKGSIPKLSVAWHAEGAIFKKPTILHGLGDAGDEAALPLAPFWSKMDAWGNSILDGMAVIASGMERDGDITVETYLYPNGPKMDEYTYKSYNRGKARLGNGTI